MVTRSLHFTFGDLWFGCSLSFWLTLFSRAECRFLATKECGKAPGKSGWVNREEHKKYERTPAGCGATNTTQTCVYTYIQSYVHQCVYACIHTYCICTRTYVHRHANPHTHIHTTHTLIHSEDQGKGNEIGDEHGENEGQLHPNGINKATSTTSSRRRPTHTTSTFPSVSEWPPSGRTEELKVETSSAHATVLRL